MTFARPAHPPYGRGMSTPNTAKRNADKELAGFWARSKPIDAKWTDAALAALASLGVAPELRALRDATVGTWRLRVGRQGERNLSAIYCPAPNFPDAEPTADYLVAIMGEKAERDAKSATTAWM